MDETKTTETKNVMYFQFTKQPHNEKKKHNFNGLKIHTLYSTQINVQFNKINNSDIAEAMHIN